MRDAPHVPELGKDGASLGMDSIGHPLPARYLLGAVDPGGPGVALAQRVLSSTFVTLTSMH